MVALPHAAQGMDVQVGPQTSSSLLSVLQSAVAERQGAPVGVIVRQPASTRQLDTLMALLGRSRGAEGALSEEAFEDILHRILTTEVSHAGSPPASEDCLKRLPRICVDEHTDLAALGNSCGILHEPFACGDVVVSLRCGHSYREDAILTWLRAHDTCPVCRDRVSDAEGQKGTSS